jgi:predicted Fe-Mo cluster-binding NifX family protein
MKLMVSATGHNLDAEVDPRFGRAACFLLVDPKTMEYEVVENTQNLEAAQGAGIQAAAHVARHNPEAVLTGHCGPKAFETLKSAGVAVCVGARGTVREAVEAFRRGEQNFANAPDVEGHWV